MKYGAMVQRGLRQYSHEYSWWGWCIIDIIGLLGDWSRFLYKLQHFTPRDFIPKNIPVKLKKKSMQYTALIKTMILHFFHGIATQCEGLYVVHTWNPSHPRANFTYISRPTFFWFTIYFIICFYWKWRGEGGGVSGWASFFQPPHFVQLVQVGRVLTLIIHQFNSKDYKG